MALPNVVAGSSTRYAVAVLGPSCRNTYSCPSSAISSLRSGTRTRMGSLPQLYTRLCTRPASALSESKSRYDVIPASLNSVRNSDRVSGCSFSVIPTSLLSFASMWYRPAPSTFGIWSHIGTMICLKRLKRDRSSRSASVTISKRNPKLSTRPSILNRWFQYSTFGTKG